MQSGITVLRVTQLFFFFFFSEELLGVLSDCGVVDTPQCAAGVRRSSAELAHQEQPCCGSVEQVHACVCKCESARVLRRSCWVGGTVGW